MSLFILFADTKLRQRTESVVNNPLQPRCCGKHKDPLQYFCNDPSCYQLLCCQCLATGEHSDHDWKELEQAFVSMEARLQQAGQVAKEAAKSARRQMSALRTEEDRLQSKCETAKASIHTNIGDIRSQFDNRKAYFEHNLEHTAQRHNFLKHRKPRESLLAELEALQELSKHGEDVLAGLNSEDTMSLKEVEKTTNRLKKIQDTVTKFQTQCSLRNTKFEANSSQVRVKLSSYGDVKVDTFEQDPYYSSSNEPYEVVSKSKQLRRARSRSLTELNSPEDPQNQFTSKRGYSKMKRPPVPKKPLGIRHESMSGAIRPTRKKGVFVLPPHPSSPTRFALSKNRTFTSRPMSADIGSQSSRNFQEIDEILYDEPFSPPKSFQIPPPPSYPPPLPASQDGAAQYIEVINSK